METLPLIADAHDEGVAADRFELVLGLEILG